MHARVLALAQLGIVKMIFEPLLADIPDDLVNKKQAGTVSPIGQTLCHAVISMDSFVNAMAQGKPTRYASGGWAAKTGGPAEGSHFDPAVNLNLGVFKDYLAAIYADVESFLKDASDEALDKEIDTPLGKMPAIAVVGALGLAHMAEHLGDVSTIKGINGLKGLPF